MISTCQRNHRETGSSLLEGSRTYQSASGGLRTDHECHHKCSPAQLALRTWAVIEKYLSTSYKAGVSEFPVTEPVKYLKINVH